MDADDIDNNPNAPTDYRCHVFHKNGGGVSYVELQLQQYYTGTNGIPYGWLFHVFPVTVINSGSAKNDLVFMGANIQAKVCRAVNKAAGVPNPGGEVPDDPFTTAGGDSYQGFGGDYYDATQQPWPHGLGDSSTEIQGKQLGCVCHYVSYDNGVCSSFLYFHILLAR